MKKRIDNINSHRTGVSTFASRTSPSTDQSLQKSFHLSHADKIELKKSPPLQKIKNTQPHNPTRQRQRNVVLTMVCKDGRQEPLAITAVLQKSGFSG